MFSIMEQQQGVSRCRRRAKERKHSLSKDKSKERWRKLLTDIHWSRCLNHLLLLPLCFINSIGSAPSGNTRHVTGEEGGNVTLPCEFEPRDYLEFSFKRQSKSILVCQNDECRFVKKGTCDIIIKDLIFSDAGKYILRVYYTDGQRKQTLEYHLHIQGKISGKTGEELKMNILVSNADKVKTNSSGEWTEVWTRGHGVSNNRLTDHGGNLTISNFTVSDTGTYRVLDSEGEILITVTLREDQIRDISGSSSGSKGKLDRDEDKPDKTEERTVASRIIVVSVSVALLVLALIIYFVIWIYRRQNRNGDQKVYKDVPMQDI